MSSARTPGPGGRGAPTTTPAPPERRYRAALARLDAAQKSGVGVPGYTRWVNRRLARYAAAAAYSWGWSSNTVTFVSAAFSAVGLVLVVFVPSSPMIGIAVGLLLAFGYVLDSADGQVARLGGTSSKAGEWLDHVVDAIRSPAIHIAVLLGFWSDGPMTWPQVVAVLYCLVTTGQFMSQILAEQLRKGAVAPSKVSGNRQSFTLLPTDFGVFCLSFLLWGWPAIFTIVYTALFVVNSAHTAISMRRRYQQLSAIDAGESIR